MEGKSRRKRKPAVPVVVAKGAVGKRRETAPKGGPDLGLRRASLFMNGRSQAVRLPKEFRFEGTHVYARKEGNRVILFTEDDWMERLLAVMGSAPDFPDRDEGVPQERPELDDLFA